MIVKELDPFNSEDPLLKAGRSAEEQMAFYLRRDFGREQEILVFNGLRLETENDAAQMDHLILHRQGTIIIESKSVNSKIQINEHGEWIRWYGRTSKGMASPILQARRQGDFLKRYLDAHAESLRDKILGLAQARFGSMTIGVLVAISDSGIIERPKKLTTPEVHKADEIPGQVKALIKEHRRINSFFNLNMNEGGYSLNKQELDRISNFLLQHHRPLNLNDRKVSSVPVSEPAAPPKASPPGQPASEFTCRHCKSGQLHVEYGKYGYYFKCQDCQGNTSINLLCPTCGSKEHVRKSGNQFFRECESCNTSKLFYTNAGD